MKLSIRASLLTFFGLMLTVATASVTFPLRRYAQELPTPPVINPSYIDGSGVPVYNIYVKPATKYVHPDLQAAGLKTSFWGYNGIFPGPTFDVQQKCPIRVNIYNKLSSDKNDSSTCQHLFPVDRQVHGAAQVGENECRIVTHLHGAEVAQSSDGYPEFWQDSDGHLWNGEYAPHRHYYDNEQRPFTTFYHDHTLGMTRLGVYAGLAGMYLLRGENEADLGLPSGAYEQPLLFQDRSFNADGTFFYPDGRGTNEKDPSEVVLSPEYFGDHMLVNGVVWPYKTVERRAYRFRIVNGCNSRFLTWAIERANSSYIKSPLILPTTWMIGGDHGFFKKPLDVTNTMLTLSPGERLDLVIDFSKVPVGEQLVVKNTAGAPFPDGDAPGTTSDDGPTTGNDVKGPHPDELILFKVVASKSGPYRQSPVPEVLDKKFVRLIDDKGYAKVPVARIRRVLLSENEMNNRNFLQFDNLLWMDEPSIGYPMDAVFLTTPTDENPAALNNSYAKPLTDAPCLGEYEVWEIVNPTEDTHPVHVHPISFQIINRQPYDKDYYTSSGLINFTDAATGAEPYESGWKDIVHAPSGFVTRIILRFVGHTGIFPIHCHILEHEDNEMMRKYPIKSGNGVSDPYFPCECVNDADCPAKSTCQNYLCTEVAGIRAHPSTLVVKANDSKGSVSVRLTKQPAGHVILNVACSQSSQASVYPRALSFNPYNWNTPQLVTITGNNYRSLTIDLVVKSSGDKSYNIGKSFSIPVQHK